MDEVIKYFVLGISLAISIGPVNIELIKRGMTKGFVSSWLVGIGGMTADLLILAIIYVGIGAYFTGEVVQLIFGVIGSLMLLQMGLQNAKKGMVAKEQHQGNTSGAENEKTSFTAGFLLAIANPLNLVFWTGIYSSLLTLQKTKLVAPELLLLSIFIGIAVSNLLFALLSSIGKTYTKPSLLRFISLASGVVLMGYGLWIGYSTVSSKLLALYRFFFA
ncbi:LysE family translocator [Brevibacillus sp. GCM10020057]|uniref:LysE family translocator n=1 Tax=Brevibacillus sp. GCM10020057 TaxID=3317327 RepID=UPI00362C387F